MRIKDCKDYKKRVYMNSLNTEINFARAFYFFAFMFLAIYSFNSLSNILTPIAISFFIWFLINGLANEIKKIPYINKTLVQFVATRLCFILILFSMVNIETYVTSSMI